MNRLPRLAAVAWSQLSLEDWIGGGVLGPVSWASTVGPRSASQRARPGQAVHRAGNTSGHAPFDGGIRTGREGLFDGRYRRG
jgi:hypothetical protein